MSITNFYLLPLDHVANMRGPAYLKWRGRKEGIDCRWSLKDFGSEKIGLVASDKSIPNALSIQNKRKVCDYLKANGIESGWIAQAEDQRELVHRASGMALAMQANQDNPVKWLKQDIYFGFTGLAALEPKEIEPVKQVPYLKIRPNFGSTWNWKQLLFAFNPFAALPATDAFTGSDGTNLTTYSANWTINVGNFQIFSNALCTANTGPTVEGGAFWNADTPATDHYSQATVAAISAGAYIGLSVRNGAGGAHTFYDYISDSGDGSYLGKYNATTYTQLGATGAVFTTSLAIRLEANGTGIRPMRAGATADIGIQTDAALTNTRFGVAGYDTGTGSRIDNLEVGNLTAAAASFIHSPGRSFAGLIGR